MSVPAAVPVVVRRSPPAARLVACCAVFLAAASAACQSPTEPTPQRAGGPGHLAAERLRQYASAATSETSSPADSTPADTTDGPTDLIIWW